MFWGVILEAGKRYNQIVKNAFHVSMASLEFNESVLQSISPKEQASHKRAAVVSVMVQHQGTEFLLCTLIHGQIYQQILDVHFDENESITFFLEGDGTVHLTGFITDDDNLQALDIDNEAPKLHHLLTRMTSEEQVKQQKQENDKQSEKSLKAISLKKKLKTSSDLHKPQKKRRGADLFDSSKKSAKKLKRDLELEDNFEDSDNEGEESSLPTSSEDEMDYTANDSLLGKRLDFSASFDANDSTGSYKPSSKGDTSASLTPPASKSPLTSTDKKKKKKLKKRQVQTGESGEPERSTASMSETKAAKNDAGSEKGTLEEKRTSIAGTEDKEKSRVKMSKKEKRKEKIRLKKEQAQANKVYAHEESKKNDQNMVVLPGGLTVKDVKKGNGPLAKAGKYIHVYYTGRLAQSDKEFDSCSKGKPFRFRLGSGEVIKGWDMGIAGMQVGGKRTIKIPAKLGYGSEAQGPIPPNSTLLFDVELKAVS